MIKGLYTAASGMISMLSAHDSIAYNMANINTPGFKQGVAVFKNFAPLLINKIDNAASGMTDNKPVPIGNFSTGSELSTVAIDFSQGDIKTTGNNTDLALKGDGFFEVKTADGKLAYTRDGSFEVNPEGFLETRDGNLVMGMDNKPVNVGTNATEFKVDSTGVVTLKGQTVGQIKVVEFENRYGLSRKGNNLYTDTGAASAKTTSSTRIVQGAQEASNANAISTMVKSIEGMRTYETLEKIIESTGSNLEKAVNQLGRIN